MVIQFTLQELMMFLAYAVGISAGILLISILWNIRKMIGILRPMVETNQIAITESISMLPGIFENVGHISINVRETTDKLKISVPVILQEVESVTSVAKGSFQLAGAVMENACSGINETIAICSEDTPGFMAYFRIFEEVLQIIYRNFLSEK